MLKILSSITLAMALSTTAFAIENQKVLIQTNMGNIEVELNGQKAPISTKNFLGYVDSGFYKGTIFHRVIPSFMIQGGGMDKNLTEKPTRAPIKNEADNGLKNERGTIAMARTQSVNSATSQFFINHQHNAMLDHGSRDYGYAVFGKVTKGMDIVDKIANSRTSTKGMYQDVPVQTVTILDVQRVK